MNWFRLHHDLVSNVKIQGLPAELFKSWVNLMCLANKNANRGVLPSDCQIAFSLHITQEEAAALIATMTELKLIDEDRTMHDWTEWNPDTLDRAARARKNWGGRRPGSGRKTPPAQDQNGRFVTVSRSVSRPNQDPFQDQHLKRSAKTASTVSRPFQDRFKSNQVEVPPFQVSPVDSTTSSESRPFQAHVEQIKREVYTEEENTSLFADGIKTEKKGKTEPPKDFPITSDMEAWAKAHEFSGDIVRLETEKMLDYFRSKGERKKDWVATWRNWLRNSRNYPGGNRNGEPRPDPTRNARGAPRYIVRQD